MNACARGLQSRLHDGMACGFCLPPLPGRPCAGSTLGRSSFRAPLEINHRPHSPQPFLFPAFFSPGHHGPLFCAFRLLQGVIREDRPLPPRPGSAMSYPKGASSSWQTNIQRAQQRRAMAERRRTRHWTVPRSSFRGAGRGHQATPVGLADGLKRRTGAIIQYP